MFRDHIKRAIKAGRRLVRGDREVAAAGRSSTPRRAPESVDLSVIPKVQDGRGDTPGPGCTTDMGRPWAAAQLLSGEGIVAVDIRSPEAWREGHLPGALSMPAEHLEEHLDQLPPPEQNHNIVVYDTVGGEEAATAASMLRQRGWVRARRLVGGYSEWVREGEEIER